MLYTKADFCPFNSDEDDYISNSFSQLNNNDQKNNCCEESDLNCSQNKMLRQIQEIDFAIIDLNLFLDTHPNCKEALDLFNKLANTSSHLKKEFQSKYRPLYAPESSNHTPFSWVDTCDKWPWEI